MIDLEWLQERLCEVLRWQLANTGDPDDGPEVPAAGRRVWSIFLALTAIRTAGMAANPIGYGEIEAYARTHREPLRPFEVTMLRALDIAFLDAVRARREPPVPAEPPPADAVFGMFRRAAALP